MATATEKYNGWTNYETWNVALWLGNNEGDYRYWTETAQECYDEAEADDTFTREERATLELCLRLKDGIEESAPDLGASMFSDLLTAALSEVNWHEIAEHYIADCDKEEELADDDDE